MPVLFAFLAIAACGTLVAIIVAANPALKDHVREGGTFFSIIGLCFLLFIATLLAAYPTGESWGVLPPTDVYQAKIVLVGEPEGPYSDEVFLMLWLPERINLFGFENPQPIKVYRVPKDRFISPEQVVTSDKIVEVAVFYSLEHSQRMLKFVPQVEAEQIEVP